MFTAIIRSYEHLAFDRTLDAKTSTFEFFVPHGHVVPFRKLMQRLETEGLVADLIELPNRFSTDS